MKNASGTDGSGLCVFTSIEIAAHWQNVEQLRGFQKEMTQEKGGGWPDKVDEMMKKYGPACSSFSHDAGASKTCVPTQERGNEEAHGRRHLRLQPEVLEQDPPHGRLRPHDRHMGRGARQQLPRSRVVWPGLAQVSKPSHCPELSPGVQGQN